MSETTVTLKDERRIIYPSGVTRLTNEDPNLYILYFADGGMIAVLKSELKMVTSTGKVEIK